MRIRRSALPLPRYVQRKPLKNGWGYFFNVPMWARRTGCPVKNEALGADYGAAVARAETILLPIFDCWRTGGTSDDLPAIAAPGTLDWLFVEYRVDRRFTKLDAKTKRNHEVGFRLVGGYVLKDGRRLGQSRLNAITTAVTDMLYEKLIITTETKLDGTIVERERRTTVNHAMKSCRRAWNVTSRRNPGKVPQVNPFAQMGLRSSERVTPTANFKDLQAFRAKAVELGHPSLATAALVAWEWLPRVKDIFCTFEISHYRPKERPNTVFIEHRKTENAWIPLFDEAGSPLFPELMAELDAIKRDRIGGLMFRRDWGDFGPWPTYQKDNGPDLTHMGRIVKKIIRAAGLPEELTFTSFAHGGFTESADADLTDAEIRAQGRNKSVKVLPRYAKRTMKQVANAAKKRRYSRTDGGQMSE
jgi:hypothetical protein